MRVRAYLTAMAVLLVPVSLAAPPAAARATGEVYLVQGVAGSTWDLAVDGETVGSDVAGKEVVGGLDLAAGDHQVSATADDGSTVEAVVDVREGSSLDVVLHLPADARRTPVLTSFVNDVGAVKDGSARLSVAHTAAVGPADIKVDGEVLFSDVASGEELTVDVPADTYRVAVVPATVEGPPVLGPVDLGVPAGRLVRVFAIGVAERGTMDAVVHELRVPVTGSDSSPRDVPGGTGGQHDVGAGGGVPGPWLLAGTAAVAGSLLVGVAVRTRRRVAPLRA